VSRDPYFDNTRAVLITLVVVGHAVARARTGTADGLYTWIYLFHMPAFALVSGYLARRFTATPRECRRLVTGLLVPYLIFDVLHAVLGWAAEGEPLRLSIFQPAFTLWFLLALIAWRLVVPVLRVLRWPVAVTVAISLLAPLGGGLGDTLGLGRIMSFLPFFAIGAAATPEMVDRIKVAARGIGVRAAALVVGVLTAVAAYLMRVAIPRGALQMRDAYTDFHDSTLEGILWRVALFIMALVLTTVLLILTPQGQTRFTRLGQATLYVYLLHALVLGPLLPVIGSWEVSWPHVLALAAGGVLLTVVLGAKPVRRATRWLVEPRIRWALRRDPQPVGTAAYRPPDPRPGG
jgi:fucose 4-O-acetylase-like acetyltransferase